MFSLDDTAYLSGLDIPVSKRDLEIISDAIKRGDKIQELIGDIWVDIDVSEGPKSVFLSGNKIRIEEN